MIKVNPIDDDDRNHKHFFRPSQSLGRLLGIHDNIRSHVYTHGVTAKGQYFRSAHADVATIPQ
jgi:hypothetical protein